MHFVSGLEDKVALIQEKLQGVIGKTIQAYEFAQIWDEEDGQWSDWMDLPIYLMVEKTVFSVSWQKFDELMIGDGRVLPFSLVEAKVRWLSKGIQPLDRAVGKKIMSIALGKNFMSFGRQDIAIWTELLIEFEGGGGMNIYNALDENGVHWIEGKPQYEMRKCL